MFNLFIASSLEKVLPKSTFNEKYEDKFSALEGELLSFQVVFSDDDTGIYKFNIEVDDQTETECYFVKNIAVDYASHERAYKDENYISHEPGIYPDLLVPVDRDWVYANNIYHSLWISVKAKRGLHNIKISFVDQNGNIVASKTVDIEIIPAQLPPQKLVYTQWFYVDCIADHYRYQIFSQELWEMVEKYLKTAREFGINMILTPVFTPPLDTAIGGERPTVQLVGIKKKNDLYEFDFSLLHRWVELCTKLGFEHFEIPHLFTQWGAEATPKIMAEIDGVEKRIFGWDVKSNSPEYNEFLSQFLPALQKELKDMGVFENTYFHISDEPCEGKNIENYHDLKAMVSKYLAGCKIIDAISDYNLIVEESADLPVIPVTATDSIKDLEKVNIPERWCYYCNAQCIDVSNRFVAMPSARNRSIGVQLFKYRMDGFLHWGYNFYNSRFSLLNINPFYESDAYGAFPSGDSISVYPGENGPMPAIGLIVFNEALQDLRALKLLEEKIGYEETVKLAEKTLGATITFNKCFSAEELLKLRKLVNQKINEA